MKDLYDNAILTTFIHNPTFQKKLLSCIKELQGSDIILWSTFSLMVTYPVALNGLTPRSSWFSIKVSDLTFHCLLFQLTCGQGQQLFAESREEEEERGAAQAAIIRDHGDYRPDTLLRSAAQ